MEREFQMEFPKGASPAVEAQARKFVEQFGADRLGEVAKLHFKTTRRVLPQGS
jgi:ribonuclease HIII